MTELKLPEIKVPEINAELPKTELIQVDKSPEKTPKKYYKKFLVWFLFMDDVDRDDVAYAFKESHDSYLKIGKKTEVSVCNIKCYYDENGLYVMLEVLYVGDAKSIKFNKDWFKRLGRFKIRKYDYSVSLEKIKSIIY